MVWCGSKNGYQKDLCLKGCVFKICYTIHTKFNSQHNWRGGGAIQSFDEYVSQVHFGNE